jgi:hypothetical protein
MLNIRIEQGHVPAGRDAVKEAYVVFSQPNVQLENGGAQNW